MLLILFLVVIMLLVMPFHRLRFFFISFLPQLGVHPETARRLARHSRYSTTSTFYTGIDETLKVEAMDKLHEALRVSRTTSRAEPPNG